MPVCDAIIVCTISRMLRAAVIIYLSWRQKSGLRDVKIVHFIRYWRRSGLKNRDKPKIFIKKNVRNHSYHQFYSVLAKIQINRGLLYTGHMRFSVAFCTAPIDISRQCWKRSFRLGFFATEAETNLRHTLGRKKWLDHHFRDTIASSFSTLEELQQENKQLEVATKAATLLNSVQKCTFLIAALVMQHTSGIILSVSKLLQKKELDIFSVIELIDSVLDILRQNKSNCENVFHKIFDQAKNECEKYDAPLLISRRYKKLNFQR